MAIAQYLDKNFYITQADNVGGGINLGNSYLKVTLDADSPGKAEKLLYIILTKADEIIRKEQLMDVDARMTYLNTELRHQTQADQRDIIIQILANQEALKATITANKRYALVLASPVFASQIPTKPKQPSMAIFQSFLLSLFLLAGFVTAEAHVPFLQRFVQKFRRVRKY